MPCPFLGVLFQHGREGAPRPGQPALDRPDRDAELARHLLDRQADQVMDHDHLAVGDGQERSVVAKLPGTVPGGLAFGGDGLLYVGGYEPSQVLRLAAAGALGRLP
jgi:hypothetical protein